MIRPSKLGGFTVTIAVAVMAVLFSAAAADAHVEAAPSKVKAGAVAKVGFEVPHGCAGSPTTKLAIKLPAGLTDVKPVAKAGWSSAVVSGVLTFSGGSLPAKTKSTFSLSATFPKAVGTLSFPTIQTCAKGSTSWIEPTVAGKAESEHPAPQVKVIA